MSPHSSCQIVVGQFLDRCKREAADFFPHIPPDLPPSEWFKDEAEKRGYSIDHIGALLLYLKNLRRRKNRRIRNR